MSDLTRKSDAEIHRQIQILTRQKRRLAAQTGMLAFGHFMMPDMDDPDDADKSEYQDSAPARCLCQLIEQVESGEKKRVAVAMPPQHGKTVNLSVHGPAWIWGRNPRARIVIVAYNQTRAEEMGRDLIKLLDSPQYKQVFPGIELDPQSRSRSYLQNLQGGRIMLAGVGGTLTGKTADYFIIDDPIKGESDGSDITPVALENLWLWFFKVAFSRGSDRTRMLITHTRWSEDDLIGRLCDPSHPERDKRFKGHDKRWFYLNLPAVVKDKDLADLLSLKLVVPTDPDVAEMFGYEPMSSLWPENKSLNYFAEWKRGDSRSFSALAMGSPAPDDGAHFLKSMLLEYASPGALPKNLRIYAASDHAVSVKQDRDFTVLGCVGVDEDDNIWVLPDLVWDRMETDKTVEEILALMQRRKPVVWWMESENISKSFGPFLIKRMQEERVYGTMLDPIRPSGDKKTRSRSIQGRMSMGKVFFPAFAPWWPNAKAELLRFPYGAHDDFVDWLSMFGLGLLKEYSADPAPRVKDNVIRSGSMEWIMASARRNELAEKRKKESAGW